MTVEVSTKANIDRIAHFFFITFFLSAGLRLINVALVYWVPDYSNNDKSAIDTVQAIVDCINLGRIALLTFEMHGVLLSARRRDEETYEKAVKESRKF